MRAALIVSAVLHLAILAAAIFSLPAAETYATPSVNALPVEIVTIADETDLTVGNPEETEVVEDAGPETVEAEEPPAPEEQPGATDTPAERIATDENAIDTTAVSAAPEPAGEPEPVQETVEAEPEPEPQPEQTVAALPEPEPEPTPEPAEEPAPTPETVVPSRKPTPPPRRTQQARVQRETQETFDADRLSQLINRTAPSGGGSGASQASVGTESGRQEASLTLSEKDALRAQMQRCWNPPIGLAGGQDIIIQVQIGLMPDGSVESIDQIGAQGVGSLYDVAADAARRAVLQCQPYRLPPEKYEVWKDVQVSFDPRELF
ncbi:cell envelope biogenesis protein TolA [Acuticoccus sp. M5D2P5]|uniref:cell envelope biogenesis protein TolA n=1 Tax=Acuticoccus kalidii TaxID=2910977 RepID=UPI001F2898F4|nr:cell envelope biogenesis protein TolA [Acuticoccus kalidii]MCF3933496.1 cell envelope biogenesis protein TolA [Acuticoccus kalidii]